MNTKKARRGFLMLAHSVRNDVRFRERFRLQGHL
jgi:hypothetical protein